MNFLTGVTNLNSMMKMTQMNMKWTERKNNPNKRQNKTEQQESPEIKRLREIAEDARRSNYVGGLKSKLKCGGSLTKDEMEYLKINHPELYQDAVENAAEREQGENTDFVKESVSEIEGELDKLTKGEQTGDTPDTPQTTTPGDTPAPETKAPMTTSQRKVALYNYAAPASAAAPAAPTASPRLPTHV